LRGARAQQPTTHSDSHHDDEDDLDRYIKEMTERAPPLSREQRDKLAAILRSNRPTG
jgi:hypothetical protein